MSREDVAGLMIDHDGVHAAFFVQHFDTIDYGAVVSALVDRDDPPLKFGLGNLGGLLLGDRFSGDAGISDRDQQTQQQSRQNAKFNHSENPDG